MTTKLKTSKTKLTSPVVITFTPEQKKKVELFAKNKGLSTASFIRFEVLKSIDEELKIPSKNNKFAKFAGSLNKQEADKMLKDIYSSRVNKE